MKVLGIVGSIRKGSIHQSLFNEYREIASGQFEMVEANLKDIPMYDGTDEQTAFQELGKKVKEADGIIFFSPEYNYSVSGVLKNAIDGLSRLDPQPFSGKPAAIVGASPGAIGSARMQYHLRQIGVPLNIHFHNKPEVMIGNALDKIEDGQITDEETKDFLFEHAKKFKAFINQ